MYVTIDDFFLLKLIAVLRLEQFCFQCAAEAETTSVAATVTVDTTEIITATPTSSVEITTPTGETYISGYTLVCSSMLLL